MTRRWKNCGAACVTNLVKQISPPEWQTGRAIAYTSQRVAFGTKEPSGWSWSPEGFTLNQEPAEIWEVRFFKEDEEIAFFQTGDGWVERGIVETNEGEGAFDEDLVLWGAKSPDGALGSDDDRGLLKTFPKDFNFDRVTIRTYLEVGETHELLPCLWRFVRFFAS
jgi:hypothetical protein